MLKIQTAKFWGVTAGIIIGGIYAQLPSIASPQPMPSILADKLNSAKTLQAEFTITETYPEPYKDLQQTGAVVLQKPSQFRVEIKRFRRIDAAHSWSPSGNDLVSLSDGKTYSYVFLHPYSTQVKQEAATPKSIQSLNKLLPILAGFYGSNTSLGKATAAEEESWEGAVYHVYEYPVTGDFTARLYIGLDSIAHRLVYRKHSDKGDIVKEWAVRNIKLDQDIANRQFEYAPPKDALAFSGINPKELLATGEIAPEINVQDVHGNHITLSSLKGKTVVLEFWATWCWPCNQSLPFVDKIAEKYKDRNVVAVAVAINDSRHGFNEWVKKHHYNHIQFAYCPDSTSETGLPALYRVSATPTTYVIDPTGHIVSGGSGFNGDIALLESEINSIPTAKIVVEH